MDSIPDHKDPHAARESSIFARPLVSLTRICCRSPVAVLALGFLLAILAVYGASEKLGFKMSRLDLINPDSGFNQLWLGYIEEFGDSDEVIVVVEGKSNVEVIPVLDVLSDKIARHPDLFQGVLHEIDLSKIKQKGLHYVPQRELEVIRQFALDSSRIVRGDWNLLSTDTMLDSFARRLQTSNDPAALGKTLHELDSFSVSLSGAFAQSPNFGSPWSGLENALLKPQAAVPDVVAAASQGDKSYFIFPTNSGVMGFVLLKLSQVDKTQMAQGSEAIAKLRNIVGEVKEARPNVQIGLTGMPIIENDEMRLSSESMTEATILAFAGVAAIFMAGFGGLRHPLFAMIGLLVAFAWTMGYITLAVGHLNILSISFGAMLVGLGTDFSVHYVARYLDLRRKGFSSEKALCQTAAVVGPGILTGAFTTAVAFYMAAFTEFTGVAELGLISGGGVIFCVLATLIIVPALIQLSDGNKINQVLPKPLDIRGVLRPALRFPATTVMAFVIAAAFILSGVPKVWYDHNLLNLQPLGLESVELEHKLLNMDAGHTDGAASSNASRNQPRSRNVWFALSIADTKEELLVRKKLFAQKYPELTVEEIVSWLPGEDETHGNLKGPLIESLAKTLENLPERPPEITLPDAEKMGAAIANLQQVLMASFPHRRESGRENFQPIAQNVNGSDATDQNVESPALRPRSSQGQALREGDGKDGSVLHSMIPEILRRLAETRETVRRMNQADYRSRMARYQSAVAGDLLTRLKTLHSMAATESPSVEDLPKQLVERFVGKRGKHLMRIYTTANIWNMDEMEKFVQAVRDIDPKATGSPLQTYESSLQMQQGFVTAAMYAFGAIVVLLLLDFRNLKDAMISMLPMLTGFGLTFGVLGWLDIPLNPANMIVLPLILGIGIDDGVHLVHDYRARCGPYRLSSSTATSVLITSLTTIVGFGSMMIASHRGLQSLGRVLVIGVFFCLATSLLVLPNLLVLWSRRDPQQDVEAEDNLEAINVAPKRKRLTRRSAG